MSIAQTLVPVSPDRVAVGRRPPAGAAAQIGQPARRQALHTPHGPGLPPLWHSPHAAQQSASHAAEITAGAIDNAGVEDDVDDEGDTGAEDGSGVELDEACRLGPTPWHAAYSTKIPNRKICMMCRVIASPTGAIGRQDS